MSFVTWLYNISRYKMRFTFLPPECELPFWPLRPVRLWQGSTLTASRGCKQLRSSRTLGREIQHHVNKPRSASWGERPHRAKMSPWPPPNHTWTQLKMPNHRILCKIQDCLLKPPSCAAVQQLNVTVTLTFRLENTQKMQQFCAMCGWNVDEIVVKADWNETSCKRNAKIIEEILNGIRSYWGVTANFVRCNKGTNHA